MGREDKKMYPTDCPTSTKWFSWFNRGARLRMGILKRQNTPLTSEAVLCLMRMMEEEYAKAKPELQEELEELACFVLASYAGGLRGEEVPLLYLKGMMKYWEEGRTHRIPHVMLTLMGRFKGGEGKRYHCLPIADNTRTGLPIRKWFIRLMHRRVERQGRKGGWLFTKRGSKNLIRAKLDQYDPLFKSYMERVKEVLLSCMPKDCIPSINMSLWRSLRRGSTT